MKALSPLESRPDVADAGALSPDKFLGYRFSFIPAELGLFLAEQKRARSGPERPDLLVLQG